MVQTIRSSPSGPNKNAGDGDGDVVGPDGVTDNQEAIFDTATGKLIKAGDVMPSTSGGAGELRASTGSGSQFWTARQSQNTVGITKTANFTIADSNEVQQREIHLLDTTAENPFEVTLPANPQPEEQHTFKVLAGTNQVNLLGNGNTIDGSVTFTIIPSSSINSTRTISWVANTNTWIIVSAWDPPPA